MWSSEIESYLSGHKYFLGCFPHDKLPPFPTEFPRTIIINTDDSSKSGDHWLALVITKRKCFYFDSFGLPIMNSNILRYLEGYSTVTYSNICLQHMLSNKCGQFCIVFIIHVNSRKRYINFISQFDFVDLKQNDIIVEHLIVNKPRK